MLSSLLPDSPRPPPPRQARNNRSCGSGETKRLTRGTRKVRVLAVTPTWSQPAVSTMDVGRLTNASNCTTPSTHLFSCSPAPSPSSWVNFSHLEGNQLTHAVRNCTELVMTAQALLPAALQDHGHHHQAPPPSCAWWGSSKLPGHVCDCQVRKATGLRISGG